MALNLNPKVKVIDYGPKLELKNGQITPNEFVWGASRITYKDIGTIEELIELKKNEEDIKEKVEKSLIKSAGAGHASMATTPGFWVFIEGNSSKLVDSMFTGARFASSLMPSGRRIPITKDQIIIPKQISKNREAENLYLKTSERNIELYHKLQDLGVSKQNASKIVQYGHRGGGFMFMPLETLIYYSKESEKNQLFPKEGKIIINQLEDFIQNHDSEIIYHARKNAPRTGCPNPNIFNNRKNLAQELIEENYEEVLSQPILLEKIILKSDERDKKLKEWFSMNRKILNIDEKLIKATMLSKSYEMLLSKIENIIEDFNDSVTIKTMVNTPWRVWGEVKRHRTLPQTTESVYSAVNRAVKITKEADLNKLSVDKFIDLYSEVVSIPKNMQLYEKGEWISAFINSIKSYERLTEMGIDDSEAIMVVPRGLKLGIIKTYDLYNLSLGYMSLRLCNTAEPEMRTITEQEKSLISKILPEPMKDLMMPKCGYVGFCPDNNCGVVNRYSSGYNSEVHKDIFNLREKEIKKEINKYF